MTITLDPPTISEPVDDGTRRELLAAGAGPLALGFAGCQGDDDEPAPRARRRRADRLRA